MTVDIPPAAREILDRIVAGLRTRLGDNLVGVYLHGSVTMGCYNPHISDIDFLVVVRNALSVQVKREVVRFFLDSFSNDKVEMSVVLSKSLVDLSYETPFDLHYTPELATKFQQALTDGSWQRWNDVVRTDSDLPAHVMSIVRRGLCFFGRPIQEVFRSAPKEHFIRSLLADMEWARDRIEQNPVYLVLNLCRFYCFLRSGALVSKDEGGSWAAELLPVRYRDTVEKAKQQYHNAIPNSSLNPQEVEAFYAYLSPLIRGLAEDGL